MREVVSSFIVGHWASSRIVGSSHVNYSSPPPNIVKVSTARLGEEYPVDFYNEIIGWFSKDGDLILEVGYGNQVGELTFILFYFIFFLVLAAEGVPLTLNIEWLHHSRGTRHL